VEGIVIRSTGSWYVVRTGSGQIYECRLKGVFRIRGLKATNPIAVGDRVEFDPEGEGPEGVIRNIGERRNYIIRRSTKLSSSVHIIAANIDQLVLIATVAHPRTSTGFIDRFLVTAEAYKIPSVIFFNKSDLFSGELLSRINQIRSVYEGIGYPCHEISALQRKGLDTLIDCLRGKTSLLAGHSGVGKSALINAIEPGLDLKTGDISSNSLKGKHTTTFAEMHPLSFGGYIIDTPGIKEFGLVDFYREELTHYFPEMFALLSQCRYHNCTHTNEPGCAVITAVEQGKISDSRYENYLNIFCGKELDENEWD
jgi:ribosome biogenesis GTPase